MINAAAKNAHHTDCVRETIVAKNVQEKENWRTKEKKKNNTKTQTFIGGIKLSQEQFLFLLYFVLGLQVFLR